MKTPFFSVVIPTYNRSADVCRAVASVLSQTDQDFEIIVVDDAGTDDTAQKLAEIKDKRISYIRQSHNAGAKAARNKGIAEAKGEWLCLLDSDDEWLPHRLEYLRESIAKHPNAKQTVFWSSLIFNRGGGVRYVKPKTSKPEHMPFFDYLMCEDGLMQTSTLAVYSDCAKKHPFNEAVLGHDDYEFLFGLEQAGLGFYQDTRPEVVWHNEDFGARVSMTNRKKKFMQWISVHEKDMSKKSMRAYKAINLSLCYTGIHKVKSVRYILEACVTGAISPKAALRTLVKIFMPHNMYHGLIKTLVRNKG